MLIHGKWKYVNSLLASNFNKGGRITDTYSSNKGSTGEVSRYYELTENGRYGSGYIGYIFDNCILHYSVLETYVTSNGELLETVSSYISDQFPDNGELNGFWYEKIK